MQEKLTVGKLKKALENVPDELEVKLESDSGLDQCDDNDFKVIVEKAFRYQYTLPDGETFQDGTNNIDYFVICANYREVNEEDKDD